MASQSIAVEARHDLTAREVDGLEDLIDEFNISRTGHNDARQLAFLAHIDGELVGAVAGFTWGGFGELRQVWIREEQRGRGLGREIMSRAIDEARSRGCAALYLATYDFQAPGFYAKLGFRLVCQIQDRPIGHTDNFMMLEL
jgi:N-acetylglutamate synthase-like GNAT family acetyltransferase